jgi:hypothetical protein
LDQIYVIVFAKAMNLKFLQRKLGQSNDRTLLQLLLLLGVAALFASVLDLLTYLNSFC